MLPKVVWKLSGFIGFIVLPVQLSIQTTESLQNKVGKENTIFCLAAWLVVWLFGCLGFIGFALLFFCWFCSCLLLFVLSGVREKMVLRNHQRRKEHTTSDVEKMNIPDEFPSAVRWYGNHFLDSLLCIPNDNFYRNIRKGCYAPQMRQGLDKYSHRNGTVIKHKKGDFRVPELWFPNFRIRDFEPQEYSISR